MALQPLLAGLTRPLAAMLFMLSPAKTLDCGTPKADLSHRRPDNGVLRRLAAGQTPAVVNLDSQEYAKTVDRQALKARPVDCVFGEYKGGGYRIMSFRAKKARGRMAPYAIEKRVVTARQLPAFASGGCSFDPGVSRVDRMVCRRRIDQ